MRKSLLFLGLLSFAGLIFSCKGKMPFMPSSSGRPYELLVVADQTFWNTPSNKALSDVLCSDVPGLPQSESPFRVMKASSAHSDHILKLVRSVIIVDIGKNYTKPKLKYESNVFAAPQQILTIQAPDDASFVDFVKKNAQAIVGAFTHFEMKCKIDVLKSCHSQQISHSVDSLFGCDIWLPVELHFLKTQTNFLWASTNTASANQNFVMYSYPYSDSRTFSKKHFITKRDSVMRINIPGEWKYIYMSTDTVGLSSDTCRVNGNLVFEVRGLWRMKGDFMGGPFVSHVFVDKSRHRVYTTEIFVYSPDKLKSNLVRGLEASLYTLRFLSKKN